MMHIFDLFYKPSEDRIKLVNYIVARYRPFIRKWRYGRITFINDRVAIKIFCRSCEYADAENLTRISGSHCHTRKSVVWFGNGGS